MLGWLRGRRSRANDPDASDTALLNISIDISLPISVGRHRLELKPRQKDGLDTRSHG